ncbi:MAG: hypothetical protein AAFP77_29500 [Bacteroidota bacterium]
MDYHLIGFMVMSSALLLREVQLRRLIEQGKLEESLVYPVTPRDLLAGAVLLHITAITFSILYYFLA